ncbi:protocatechuate 3,4-dioxygenase subunit alpha [Yoonia sp.]|uniref:protocatechuate 3,4-dioxygenase subunit alpha n=1 Tax=Yoonia sp. TaxID=2212373 RepID=UPI002E0AB103|nr:protocatechuate 3,4-dioxygenase subunit alpha [Yoonia sp.]
MTQSLNYLKETPSQTAGPYVHIGLAPGDAGFDIYAQELGHDIAGPNAKGQRITVTGMVTDGTGAPVKDVLIEIWQANTAGIYAGAGDVEEGFRGWGRVIPDFDTGKFTLETIKPGPVAGTDGRISAPHLNLWLVARGINVGLNTRMYFDDESANASDPVLNLIEQAHRRDTLIAKGEANTYEFNISLQGENETVFLDV